MLKSFNLIIHVHTKKWHLCIAMQAEMSKLWPHWPIISFRRVCDISEVYKTSLLYITYSTSLTFGFHIFVNKNRILSSTSFLDVSYFEQSMLRQSGEEYKNLFHSLLDMRDSNCNPTSESCFTCSSQVFQTRIVPSTDAVIMQVSFGW